MNHPLRNSSSNLGNIPASQDQSRVIDTSSPSSTSRRSFLSRGLTAAAVPAALVAGSSLAKAGGTPSALPSYYPGGTKSKFQEIQQDEVDHVIILTELITGLGGTPRPLPTFTGIQNLSASQFLTLSDAFENTGVHAYYGAAPYISNPNVLGLALGIALVEAYHAGFINALANVPLIPGGGPLATPYTIPQIITAISPFVVNLNDNGAFPPSFSTTPSATNDIAILNFALLLEQLEAEFYFYNVPALFP